MVLVHSTFSSALLIPAVGVEITGVENVEIGAEVARTDEVVVVTVAVIVLVKQPTWHALQGPWIVKVGVEVQQGSLGGTYRVEVVWTSH
jgi:hypothetical protein